MWSGASPPPSLRPAAQDPPRLPPEALPARALWSWACSHGVLRALEQTEHAGSVVTQFWVGDWFTWAPLATGGVDPLDHGQRATGASLGSCSEVSGRERVLLIPVSLWETLQTRQWQWNHS